MAWSKYATVLAVFVVAVTVGGAAVRVGILATETRALVVLGLIAALVVLVWIAAAKSRRWLANPYW